MWILEAFFLFLLKLHTEKLGRPLAINIMRDDFERESVGGGDESVSTGK